MNPNSNADLFNAYSDALASFAAAFKKMIDDLASSFPMLLEDPDLASRAEFLIAEYERRKNANKE